MPQRCGSPSPSPRRLPGHLRKLGTGREEAWDSKAEQWKEARLPVNRERAAGWKLWNEIAKEFLIDRAAAAPEGEEFPLDKPRAAYRGRGRVARNKMQRLAAPQVRGEALAVNIRQERLASLLKRLEEVTRRIRGRDAMHAGKCWTREEATRRQAALQGLRVVWDCANKDGGDLPPDAYDWQAPGFPGLQGLDIAK